MGPQQITVMYLPTKADIYLISLYEHLHKWILSRTYIKSCVHSDTYFNICKNSYFMFMRYCKIMLIRIQRSQVWPFCPLLSGDCSKCGLEGAFPNCKVWAHILLLHILESGQKNTEDDVGLNRVSLQPHTTSSCNFLFPKLNCNSLGTWFPLINTFRQVRWPFPVFTASCA